MLEIKETPFLKTQISKIFRGSMAPDPPVKSASGARLSIGQAIYIRNPPMQKGWVRPWAFPQSPVAKFDFVHFPIKKYGWGVWFLDPAFDGFCGTPFIYFLCCMVTVTAVKTHLHEILRRERWIWTIGSNVVPLHLHLPSQVVLRLFHSFVYCGPFSVIGLAFASLSFSQFLKRCS